MDRAIIKSVLTLAIFLALSGQGFAQWVNLEIGLGGNANVTANQKGSLIKYFNIDSESIKVSNPTTYQFGYGVLLDIEFGIYFPSKNQKEHLLKSEIEWLTDDNLNSKTALSLCKWLKRKTLNRCLGFSLGVTAFNNGIRTNYLNSTQEISIIEDTRISGIGFPVKIKFGTVYLGLQYNKNLFFNNYQVTGKQAFLSDINDEVKDNIGVFMGFNYSIIDLRLEYLPSFVFFESSGQTNNLTQNGYIISFKSIISIPISLN